MSRHLKLIAAVAVVLVAVSGFSPERRGGGRSHGGGCSSSSSSSHSSTYDDDDYDDDYDSDSDSSYDSGSVDSSPSSPTGTIVRCAAQEGSDATAVVSVLNNDAETQSYTVTVDFRDSSSTVIDSGEATVTVDGDGSQNVDVQMEHPDRVGEVAECEVSSVS
jgi:hypothetical protein